MADNIVLVGLFFAQPYKKITRQYQTSRAILSALSL